MKNKIVKIFLMLIAFIVTIANVTMANSNNYNMGIKTNKDTIKEGETLEITLSLKDINITTGDKGLGAYQANIEFNTNIFEYVSIKGLNSWDTPVYNDGGFSTTTSTGEVIKSDEDVAVITLKAKTNLSNGNTTIKINNISASTGKDTVTTSDVTKTITVSGKSTNGTSNNTTNNNTQTASNKNQTNKTTNTINSKNDKTTTTKTMPKTGETNIMLYIIIAIVMVSAITGIYVYRNNQITKL